MKIPRRLQIFDTPVWLSSKDVERLSPHLSGWNRLHEIMLLGVNEPDLRRLVVLELMGARRKAILFRLVSRLNRLVAQRNQASITKELGHA